MPSKPHDADVIIVGGGLAGLSFASLLGTAGVKVICIDRDKPQKQATAKFDGRTTAISSASKAVLDAAGVWTAMLPDAEPILDIRVVDGASPFFLHFDCDDVGGDPFGWIIDNQVMRRRLFEHVKKLKTVTHMAPALVKGFENRGTSMAVKLKSGRVLTAPLVVGADGRMSPTRDWAGIETKQWSYNQSAIICCVEHELDHENVAVEHFMPAGPFAILPMTRGKNGAHRSSVVWTEHGDDAGAAAKLSDKEFNAALQERFGDHLGRVKYIGVRQVFPLGLIHAKTYIAPRMALMGEAAHAIHPIAGQGLNLSMRDIACLAELIVDHLRLGLDIGSDSLLQNYESWRRADNTLMAVMTDGLNKLFSNDVSVVRHSRGFGLGIVNKLPPLKKFFMGQAMGMAGSLPRIVRGEPL